MKCPMRAGELLDRRPRVLLAERDDVDDRVEIAARHRALQRLRVGAVADDAAHPGAERIRGAAAVEQRDPVAVHEQALHHRQADEAAAPDDEHLHGAILPLLRPKSSRRARPPCARRRAPRRGRGPAKRCSLPWARAYFHQLAGGEPDQARSGVRPGGAAGDRVRAASERLGQPAAVPAACPTSGKQVLDAAVLHRRAAQRRGRRARWRRARAPPSAAPPRWPRCPRLEAGDVAASLRAAAIRASVARRSGSSFSPSLLPAPAGVVEDEVNPASARPPPPCSHASWRSRRAARPGRRGR